MTKSIQHMIEKYWEDAKTDYNIDGRFLSCKTLSDRLLIEWEEEGTRYTIPIINYTDYTAEQLFNIWMEQDWSFYAD